MTEDTDIRRKKLRFRAWHRGTREMDLLMGGFADTHLAELSAAELDAFEDLLDRPDLEVYDWITGAVPTPGELQSSLMKKLQAFDFPSAAGFKKD